MFPQTGGSTHPAVIEAAIDWFHENHAKLVAVAECPALKACYTQGKTYEEVIENIKDVIALCLEDYRGKG